MEKRRLLNNPHCPNCKKLLDSFTAVSVSGSVPKPGDITVCLYCSTVLQFSDDLSLIEAEADEIVKIDLVDLSRAQKIAKQFRQKKSG